jgi:hypothetical protein
VTKEGLLFYNNSLTRTNKLSPKEEQNYAFYRKIDGTGNHHVK